MTLTNVGLGSHGPVVQVDRSLRPHCKARLGGSILHTQALTVSAVHVLK
jgi:hypothetical protein